MADIRDTPDPHPSPRNLDGSGAQIPRGSRSRRSFLRMAAALPVAGAFACGFRTSRRKPTDVRIESVAFGFEEFVYRAPYVFGGRSVDRATILNVTCRLRTADGRSAEGRGSMPLGNMWAFPSKTMTYDTTLAAMKELARRISAIFADFKEVGHPVALGAALESECLRAADGVTRDLNLASPIPKLCTLVTASPFDAAVHDGYGKALGLNSYLAYGPEFMASDLEPFLGRDFRSEHLDRYILPEPSQRTYVFHSVGAGDPITKADIRNDLADGLPQTLSEWIDYNGIRRVKIKLNGQDLSGDLERTVRIDRVTGEAQRRRGVDEWFYCLDFNENCPDVEFLLEFLRRLEERTPDGFRRVLYVEQPTARDLKAHRANVMHKAARLRPVVIDESLTDLESLLLAREMGYSGIALKACKGQGNALLMAAAGSKYGMFLCVQDLTCPGAALLHSASIACHVPGNSGLEANARQYMPAANQPWERRFPGIFRVKDGTMNTGTLRGLGLAGI